MNARPFKKMILISALSVVSSIAPLLSAQSIDWNTAVNNGTEAPGGVPGSVFLSYNQPALNDAGIMVFRARSRVDTGSSVTSGIYRLDLFGGPIEKLALRGDVVPDPNNTVVSGSLATFNDFPSTPRIDPGSILTASRGQHLPVWTFLLDGLETRVGTAGIYAYDSPPTSGVTGASLLGAVFEELFTVNGAEFLFRRTGDYDLPEAPDFRALEVAAASRGDIALGVYRAIPDATGNRLMLNPARNEPLALADGDQIVVLADTGQL